jgi:hypothetical protein
LLKQFADGAIYEYTNEQQTVSNDLHIIKF